MYCGKEHRMKHVQKSVCYITWLASDDKDSSWPSSLIFSFNTCSISSWPITELSKETLKQMETLILQAQMIFN